MHESTNQKLPSYEALVYIPRKRWAFVRDKSEPTQRLKPVPYRGLSDSAGSWRKQDNVEPKAPSI